MKKSIYKITNLINNKSYIGQTKDIQKRFSQHKINYGSCGGQGLKSTSLINQAIQKYGVKNFNFEILEQDIENYNDREKFWIEYYNSKTPNGYNICDGGENPPIKKGEENGNSFHSKEEIREIKKLLKNTNLSFKEIAKKYNYNSHSTIGYINQGIIWYDENEVYPLRNTGCNKNLSSQKVQLIIHDLLNTNLTQQAIADKYNIGRHIVTAINNGESYKQINHTYPLRQLKKRKRQPLTPKEVENIIFDIKNTKNTFTDIANKYHVSVATISNINKGKAHKQKNFEYPIR